MIPAAIFTQEVVECGNHQFLKSQRIIVVAPHPDDEILGFAGLIFDALQAKKEVKVVIVTNGDGYGSACYFWQNGFPREDSMQQGPECSRAFLEYYGKSRISESKRALSLLGLDSSNVITLGYPDGWVGEMYRHPDSVYLGNTSRLTSNAGKSFTSGHLKEELKAIFTENRNEEIYSLHHLDSHDDHASLAKFIQDVRTELVQDSILFPFWMTIIHEPYGDNNRWPNPSNYGMVEMGTMMNQREKRYTPWEVLQPPQGTSTTPVIYFTPEELWSDQRGKSPLMRQALDQFATGIGCLKWDGKPVSSGYEGYLDRDGYFLSFMKRNHLYWRAADPVIYSETNGICTRTKSIHPLSIKMNGKDANGGSGYVWCESELFPSDGVVVGSGLDSGTIWYQLGPLFSDSVCIQFTYGMNSWQPGNSYLAIYNFTQGKWSKIFTIKQEKEMAGCISHVIKVTPDEVGKLNQIRLGFLAEKPSRLHVKMLMVR